MLAKIYSAAVLGIDAYIVDVEAHLESQLPALATVGLPDRIAQSGNQETGLTQR